MEALDGLERVGDCPQQKVNVASRSDQRVGSRPNLVSVFVER